MVTSRWRLADLPVLLLLAALYVAAAKLGLKLALVHASATAVWPPTGIALAALLLLGHRMWPSIFIGAFVANVTTAGSVTTSLGIATGNTLEAVLGVYLVRRFASGRHPFVNGQEVIKFLFLAAMVSTMVSATVGVGAFRFGQLEPATGSLVLGSMALWGTLHGYGPFIRENLNESLLLLQAFMGITALFALAFAAVVAERRRVNEERLALLPLAQAAQQLAEDAERRASFLADASAVLGSSLDYDATLHRMVKLAVPLLADGCSVDLLEDSGTTRRVAQIHIVPAKDEMVRDARARHGVNPSSPCGVPAVLRPSRSPEVYQAAQA